MVEENICGENKDGNSLEIYNESDEDEGDSMVELEIEEKMNSGHFDNIYENVCDMYKSEILIVHEFNKQIEFFLSEASP